jgi:beta-phosphoglucomutase
MKNRPLKAVLIDFDGTILDSLPALYKTYYDFLQTSGFEGSSDEFRLLNGITLNDVVIFLINKYHLKEPLNDLTERYYSLLRKNYHTELKLFPGVKEFLIFAKEHHLELGVVSSGSSDFIQTLLKAENVAHFFTHIVTPNKELKSKPAPDLYLKALSLFAINGKEAVAVEDAPLGVQAAVEAQIPTLQITHGEKITPTHSSTLVHNWGEVQNYVSERV